MVRNMNDLAQKIAQENIPHTLRQDIQTANNVLDEIGDNIPNFPEIEDPRIELTMIHLYHMIWNEIGKARIEIERI